MQEIRKAQQLSFLCEDQGQVVREAESQAIRFILPHASMFPRSVLRQGFKM